MKIILIRHGLTRANIEKRYSKEDTRLDKSGLKILENTKRLVKNYNIDRVYTSKLYRSKETAEILGFDNYVEDKRLNEMDFGDFKGKKLTDVRKDYKKFFEEEKADYFNKKYPQGESRLDVIKRTSDFLDEVSKTGKDILAVSHGIAIRSALFWVLKDLRNWDNFWIDNGSLTIFNLDGSRKIIESINIK